MKPELFLSFFLNMKGGGDMFEKAIQSTWISQIENQAKSEQMENIVITAEIVIEQELECTRKR